MPSERIVDTRLFVPLDLGSVQRANARFAQDPKLRGHLAAQLISYDTIVIPTKDFGIVPTLFTWLGRETFVSALEAGAFSFQHMPSMLGYTGNGVGISGFLIMPSEERPFRWWQTATFGELTKAADLQIANAIPSLSSREAAELTELVISKSVKFDYSNDEFMENVERESYEDIMGSPELQLLITATSDNPEKVNLREVPGVGPNQMRVSRDGPIKDGADVILRVAEMNRSLFMASKLGSCDLLAPRGAELVITSKLSRHGVKPSETERVLGLLELAGVPDVGAAVAEEQVELADIWRIRQSRNSRQFREWLQESDAHSARDLEKAYVESLGSDSAIESWPARTLRFLITTGIGVANPIAGLVVGATDSLFVERLLGGYRPKFFIDDLKTLLRDDR